jgi:hypothetical protein
MTNAILSIVTAAAIAIGSVGATAPAAAANLAPAAPAVSQSASDLLVEVRHGGRHKGGFKRHGGKRGFHFHIGKRGFSYGAPAYCFKNKRVWTRFGWKVKRVRVC